MQTRRDQLQAYRFQNRRALAALVTGEPNVVEPPMRRLTVTTISGIMIAILVAVGFALFGVIRPASGDSYKQSGAIIDENQTGARYIYSGGELHPVLNYASAVLAVGGTTTAPIVHVDRDELDGVKRGAEIGIAGLPDSLPDAAGLATAPWSVCSRLSQDDTGQLQAKVDVLAGSDAGAQPIRPGTGVVVSAITGGEHYLLFGGHRLALSSPSAATSLGLSSVPAVKVGTAFINGIPAGPDLSAPTIPFEGQPAAHQIFGRPVVIGQLLHATDEDKYYIYLKDGPAALDETETDLLRTLPLTGGTLTGGTPLPAVPTDVATVSTLRASTSFATIEAALKGLPSTPPALAADAATKGGICAVYGKGATEPTFAVPPGLLPAFTSGTAITSESAASKGGTADEVVLPAGGAALVRSSNGAKTSFLIAAPGEKFAVTSDAVLAGFGYSGVTPAIVPQQLLQLILKGPALDPTAARQ